MKMKNIIMAVLMAMCIQTAMAQNLVTVKGTVTDLKGEPLIGATIRIAGEKKGGTVSDLDGNFVFQVPEGTKKIQVDYIGFKSQVVNVKNGKANVSLQEDNNVMDDVVVIGYGSVKRGDITNAVAKVDGEVLEDRVMSSLGSALQGELAGVEIRNETGMPGGKVSINVRGNTSINDDYNASPLIVVDGIPMDDDFDLGMLNTQDIKSIEVLKDASSSAIYGSRGANGVIIVSTKTSKEDGKTTVTASANFALSSLMDKVDVFTPQEWIAYAQKYVDWKYMTSSGNAQKGALPDDDFATRMALTGGASSSTVPDARWSMPDYGGLALIDWQDEMYRTAMTQKYDVNVSSGNKQSSYRASVGFINQDGIVINTNYKRINALLNAKTTVKDRLTLGVNLQAQFATTTGAAVDGSGTSGLTLQMPPVAEPSAGIYSGADPYMTYNWAGSYISPVATMELNSLQKETMRIMASATATYRILDGLDAEATGSWLFTDGDSKRFINSGTTSRWYDYSEGYNSSASWQGNRQQKYLGQALLRYVKTFGNHSVNAVAGWSIESTTHGSKYSMKANRFPNNSLQNFNMTTEEMTEAYGSFATDVRMVSYFARAEYGFDDRYLVSASLRRDGSSKFGRNNRWGTFPAVSAAWRTSNEKFWSQDWIVNQAKLRISYGVNGSNSIPANAANGLLTNLNYFTTDGALANGFIPSSTDNTSLGWQKTDSWNLGIDLGLLKNRISLAVDLYRKDIRDMLYSLTVPAILGYTKAYNNVGNIRNEGIELELKTENLTGKLRWTTRFNLGYNHNEVMDLGSNSTITKEDGNGHIIEVFEVGRPAGEYYLFDAIGVFRTQADLDNNAKQQGATIGCVMYRDKNNDNVIDDNDRYYMGSPRPAVTYGMTNTFKYKNWDFSFLFTAQTGGKVYSMLGRKVDNTRLAYSTNRLSKWTNAYIGPDNPGAGIVGMPGTTVDQEGDSRWLYSSDFLKLQNVTLGYRLRLPKAWLARQVRFVATAENLFMLHKYDGGYSPEARNSSGLVNYDAGSYPLARSFSLGATVTF